ncbi:MAG: hypothetical protein AMS27_11690 [Bacteroides sp. SM23_62_1]|nr:MAG: hypothetical protein AMS27_11690 [Bacteroides sp. SM23_62_1]
MRRFNSKGMWLFPNLIRKRKKKKRLPEDEMIVKECYCPNGHNLVSPKVEIKGQNGILMKVKKNRKIGFIALSPICGDKSKVTLDIDLEEGEILELLCPACNVPLPVYAPCECGGDMITLFADKQGNYCNCIGVCNRVGCTHAEIKRGSELFNIYRRKGEIRGTQNYL